MASASTALARHGLVANFATRLRQLDSNGPHWVRELRRRGRARFEALGLPGPGLEEWRGTSVAPIAGTEFVPAASAADPLDLAGLPEVAQLDLGGPRLIFIDGRFCAGPSRGVERPGLWIGGLAAALAAIPERLQPHLAEQDPGHLPAFAALNSAFLDDGAALVVGAGVDAGAPVQLVFATTGGARPIAVHLRTLVAVGPGARLRVVETHVGAGQGAYLTNGVTQIFAGDGAQLDHCRVQLDGPLAFHLGNVRARQMRDSRCVLRAIDLGGRLVRNDVVATLDGEGAECRLDGLYLTSGEQHVDNHTVLEHAQPRGSSRELYKGILSGRSRSVFNGRIVVRANAQQTDAKQSNPNLVLSRGALAQTRPQLEILANDVRCTHGATIGRLDEEAVFYLRSRGLGAWEARQLILAGFAGEVLDRLELPALRAALERAVAARLPGVGGGDVPA